MPPYVFDEYFPSGVDSSSNELVFMYIFLFFLLPYLIALCLERGRETSHSSDGDNTCILYRMRDDG